MCGLQEHKYATSAFSALICSPPNSVVQHRKANLFATQFRYVYLLGFEAVNSGATQGLCHLPGPPGKAFTRLPVSIWSTLRSHIQQLRCGSLLPFRLQPPSFSELLQLQASSMDCKKQSFSGRQVPLSDLPARPSAVPCPLPSRAGMDDQLQEGPGPAPPPTELGKNLRCCYGCRLVKTFGQFYEQV